MRKYICRLKIKYEKKQPPPPLLLGHHLSEEQKREGRRLLLNIFSFIIPWKKNTRKKPKKGKKKQTKTNKKPVKKQKKEKKTTKKWSKRKINEKAKNNNQLRQTAKFETESSMVCTIPTVLNKFCHAQSVHRLKIKLSMRRNKATLFLSSLHC